MTSAELMTKVKAIYDRRLRENLERTHLNSFLAIEPESGDYFLGRTLSEAAAAARAAYPDRQAGVLRVGHPAALHMGTVAL
jgi:hypothetical protein